MDIDSLLPLVQGMMNSGGQYAPRTRSHRWKFCVALAADGWKAISSARAGKVDIMVTWAKEGKENVDIRLNVIEQGLWIDYLQRKEKHK